MDEFKIITIDDYKLLTQYLNRSKHYACDYNAANLILWAGVYGTQYAVAQDMLFIKFIQGERINFAFPMGNGDLKKAFAWLAAYCEKQNIEFRMNLVESHMFEKIEKLFPGEYEISYIRNNADYIYKTEDLKNLSGKKYHDKKNHINKFIKTHENWRYETITDGNTQECIDMVKEWCVQNACGSDKSKMDEVCVLIRGLKNRELLNMKGGIIRIGNRIVAMTMGERSSEDMFTIHFEKAYPDVRGAYPMINQQFIIHELSDYTYVNREEDMGIEGLRKAKLSYNPVFILEKGVLIKRK